jgi:TatA/E family protein of Tat protein translocase
MGPIGWPELVILLIVVLIVFGPGKLPDIGNAIGRGVREFRKASNDLESSIRGDTKKGAPAAAASATPAAAAPATGSPAAAPTASDETSESP